MLSTGWLGRYLNTEYPGFPLNYPNAKDPDPLAVQVGANLPLLFQGPNAQMSMNVSNPDILEPGPMALTILHQMIIMVKNWILSAPLEDNLKAMPMHC